MFKTALLGVITMLSVGTLYPNTMKVTDIIDLKDNTQVIELEDYNGNVWEYETDSTDLFINDTVSVILDDMGTDIIYDDEIVSIRYNAWTITR